MTPQEIERINFLARKKKAEGLSEEELAEQAMLRRKYIDSMRASLEANLKSIVIQEEDGTRRPLTKKN